MAQAPRKGVPTYATCSATLRLPGFTGGSLPLPFCASLAVPLAGTASGAAAAGPASAAAPAPFDVLFGAGVAMQAIPIDARLGPPTAAAAREPHSCNMVYLGEAAVL